MIIVFAVVKVEANVYVQSSELNVSGLADVILKAVVPGMPAKVIAVAGNDTPIELITPPNPMAKPVLAVPEAPESITSIIPGVSPLANGI